MKLYMKLAFVILAVTVPIFLILYKPGAETASPEKRTFRIIHDNTESHALHLGFLELKKKLESSKILNLEVQIYPSARLGDASQNFNNVRLGNVEMTALATVLLSPTVPEFHILDLFYLFNSVEHARRALDGPPGQRLLEVLEPLGLKGIGYGEAGMRNFTSRKPLRTVEDLTGLKIRSANNPLQIQAWKSAKLDPIPLIWPEIFLSLQQRLIDAQESPTAGIWTAGFYQVQDYLTITEHIYTNFLYVVNGDFWDRFTPEQQREFRRLAEEMIDYERRTMARQNNEFEDLLRSEGQMKISRFPEAERRKLKKDLNISTRVEARELVGPDLFDELIEEIARLK